MARESAGEMSNDEATPAPAENDWQDVDIAVGSQANVAPLYARTTTVSDPMTMALLAEVARASKTMEIDPIKIDEAQRAAISDDDEPDAHEEITKPEVVHPHLKKRRS